MRWQIFKYLQMPYEAKALLWARLTLLAADAAWLTEVTDIVDRLVAADSNPNSLLGNTKAFSPGLKKLDVIEWYEGGVETAQKEILDRLLQDLIVLVGRASILAQLPAGTDVTATRGHGFS